MSQCKEPLDSSKPNINICVKEEGHTDAHYTYGLGWNHIQYSGKVRPGIPTGDNGEQFPNG